IMLINCIFQFFNAIKINIFLAVAFAIVSGHKHSHYGKAEHGHFDHKHHGHHDHKHGGAALLNSNR
ncbi:hypothetical protein ACUWCT_28920, partial [Klebsiella pneumoniae]